MNKKITIVTLLVSIFIFGSCKPKQSAYKSVYESAKEKESTRDDEDIELGRPATSTPSSANETVRKEKITPVYEADASGLKAYSVVIAAMGMKPNAEALKRRMENKGYKIILVQNEQSIYRVIIASSDNKNEAIRIKNKYLSDFMAEGSMETLKATYGLPFNDWWILQRDF